MSTTRTVIARMIEAEACGPSKAGAGQSPYNYVDANGNPASRAMDFGVFDPDGTYITRARMRATSKRARLGSTLVLWD